jgi:predicted CoA-binding protein
MISQKNVQDFLTEKVIAVAGVSRNKQKFGNEIYKQLKIKGYTVYGINPNMSEVEGDKCYPSISSLPEKPGAVVSAVNQNSALNVAIDTYNAGISNLWIQSGGESQEAIDYCIGKNMNVIYKECILMFAQPSGFHKFHRWVNGIFGKLPV